MRVLAGKASRGHEAALYFTTAKRRHLNLFKGGNGGSTNGRDKPCLVLVCKGLAAIYLKSLDVDGGYPLGDGDRGRGPGVYSRLRWRDCGVPSAHSLWRGAFWGRGAWKRASAQTRGSILPSKRGG